MHILLAFGLSALLASVNGQIVFPDDSTGNTQSQIPKQPVRPDFNGQQAQVPSQVNNPSFQPSQLPPQQPPPQQFQPQQFSPQQQSPNQQFPPQQSPNQQFQPQQFPSQQSPPQQFQQQQLPPQQSQAQQFQPQQTNSPFTQGSGSPTAGVQLVFQREEKKPEIPCTTYKNEQGSCYLLLQCATFTAEIAELSRSPCQISKDQQGVCCLPEKKTIDGSVGGSGVVLQKLRFPTVPVPTVGQQQINFAVDEGLNQIKQTEIFERQLVENNVVAEVGTPVQLHALLFPASDDIVQIAKNAEKLVAASVNLVNEFNLTKDQGSQGLPQFSTQESLIKDTCPPEPICQQTRYRSNDGSCNNLQNKNWGKARTALQRVLPPDYSDGVNSPRASSSRGPLPSPRLLSSSITLEGEDSYQKYTMQLMQWGQFLDHDITHTPLTKGSNNAAISCCKNGQLRPRNELHPACLPIDIPPNDSFYSQHGQRCMEFVRSFPAVRPACNFGPREQMNQITAFIDGSNVYGSSETQTADLRSFRGGQLKSHFEEGRSLLPPNAGDCRQRERVCFKAGDKRVNEQPNLVVTHTIWMRQHNRIAQELQRLNPGWSDETVYQEARRIVIAQMQHITYKEYLPIVLGKEYMEDFGLIPLRSGFSNAYREDVDPTINNAFSTAAFRYGHTLVAGTMKMFNQAGNQNADLKLSHNAFAPFMLYDRGALDDFLRGLSKQPSEKFDNIFSEEVTNKLFAGRGAFGMDLVALNIQRGRDHGLPDYNSWRKICGFKKAKTFQDLRNETNPNILANLERVYSSVDDIDFYIGGITENPYRGSSLGPTFLCIVGDQFARLKLGDRFYYENGGLPSSFTESQLNEIRKTSLARIMCDNSDNMERIQPLAFNQAVFENRPALCRESNIIPKMNLEPWRNSL